MLARQIGHLDPVHIYQNKLPTVFEWLEMKI